MSDHDASPKEWTHAHSLRHGPQRWVAKRISNAQRQAMQRAMARQRSLPNPGTAAIRPQIDQENRHKRARSQNGLLALIGGEVDESSSQSSSVGSSALVGLLSPSVPVVSSVAEEDEFNPDDLDSSIDQSDEFIVNSQIGLGGIMPLVGGYADAPIDAPHTVAGEETEAERSHKQFNQIIMQHQNHRRHAAHCATCMQLESASAAAAAISAASISAHSSPLAAYRSVGSAYPHSAQTVFSPYALPSSRSLSVQSTPGTVLPPPSMADAAATGATATATHTHRRQASIDNTQIQDETKTTMPMDANKQTAANASVTASATHLSPVKSHSADPVLVSSPPPAPVAPLVPSSPAPMLPRWFLVLLAMLKETDGRDKLAKVVQYGGRTLKHILQRLPAAAFWVGIIRQTTKEGGWDKLIMAIKVLIIAAATGESVQEAVSGDPASAMLGGVPAAAAAAIQQSYATDTSAFASRLSSSPLYSGGLARLDVLTAALSSARRVIRVCKWSYTLPGWCRTFQEWRRQVQAGIERELQRKEKEDNRKEEEKQQGEKGKEESESENGTSSPDSSSSAPAPFRFSHPHPTHVWRRLPWLSSVELLDLTLAVATDCADDLEWLSKYRLFPDGLGYTCGRAAMCLWFSTVLLDIALTGRVLRHYRYQRKQIRLQIDQTRSEYEAGCDRLAQQQALREEKAYRRLARELKETPFRKKREKHPDADPLAPASDVAPVGGALDSIDPTSSSSQSADPISPSSPIQRPRRDHSPDRATHMSGDVTSDSDDDDACDAAHGSTVASLHRLSELHHQLSATNVSLGLQYLNFAKFVADLGCALPMALNVHKEWDGMVQTTGLISGILGLYKLAITIRPAS